MAGEPGHQELCDLEQAFVLKAIREDLDLDRHMDDAVQSLRSLPCRRRKRAHRPAGQSELLEGRERNANGLADTSRIDPQVLRHRSRC